jgi:hypothetical protein
MVAVPSGWFGWTLEDTEDDRSGNVFQQSAFLRFSQSGRRDAEYLGIQFLLTYPDPAILPVATYPPTKAAPPRNLRYNRAPEGTVSLDIIAWDENTNDEQGDNIGNQYGRVVSDRDELENALQEMSDPSWILHRIAKDLRDRLNIALGTVGWQGRTADDKAYYTRQHTVDKFNAKYGDEDDLQPRTPSGYPRGHSDLPEARQGRMARLREMDDNELDPDEVRKYHLGGYDHLSSVRATLHRVKQELARYATRHRVPLEHLAYSFALHFALNSGSSLTALDPDDLPIALARTLEDAPHLNHARIAEKLRTPPMRPPNKVRQLVFDALTTSDPSYSPDEE